MSRFLQLAELTSPLPFPRSSREPLPQRPHRICCGLRDGTRPLWRGQVLSTEAIQAVHSLKLAKSLPQFQSHHDPNSNGSRIEKVFRTRLARLLKADQIAVLNELRRQNEWELALQVFAFIRKEAWYKPDLSLYGYMIYMMGRNKLIEHAEQLFYMIRDDGLEPDTRVYTEIIGAFLQAGMVVKAMDMYRLMKESGNSPDKLTFTVLIRNLEKAGEEDLASAVRNECVDYVDFPDKFLKEVDQKYPKRKSVKIV